MTRSIERPLTSRSKLRGSSDVTESRLATSAGIAIKPVTPRTWSKLSQEEDPSSSSQSKSMTFYGNEAYGQPLNHTNTTSSLVDKDARQSHPQYQPLSARTLHTSPSPSTTARPVSRLGMDRSGATSRFTVPKVDSSNSTADNQEKAMAEQNSSSTTSVVQKRPPVRTAAFKISREMLAARMNSNNSSHSGSNEAINSTSGTTTTTAASSPVDKNDINTPKQEESKNPPSPVVQQPPIKSNSASLIHRSSSASSTSSSSRKLSAEATAAFVSASKSFVMPQAINHGPNSSSSSISRRGSSQGKRSESGSNLSGNELDPSLSTPLATYSAARKFLLSPGPMNEPLKCRVERMKSGILGSSAQYAMLLEDGGTVMLTARRHRRANGSVVFQIFVNASPNAPADTHICVAKITTSFLGTEYVMSGIVEESSQAGNSNNNNNTTVSCELGAVLYAQNLMGTKGPRKVTVVLPKLVPSGDSTWELQPALGQDSLLTKQRHGDTNSCIVLNNRAPRWNPAIGAYCLNFGGRVTHASVKNMQLVTNDNPDRVIIQFGRVGAEEFTLDYAFPVTPLQAFLVALSSLDPKIGCE